MPTFEINSNPSNSYCFVTKGQVKARIEAEEPTFLLTCLGILYCRQTEDEQATKDTKHKNKRGFMSSHAVHGTRIAEQVAEYSDLETAWASLSDVDKERVEAIVPRYTKQLTEHFRAEQMLAMDDEKRAEMKAKFGV